MKIYTSEKSGLTTMDVYNRELNRMNTACGDDGSDWLMEECIDYIEMNTKEDGTFDFESFEKDMIEAATFGILAVINEEEEE